MGGRSQPEIVGESSCKISWRREPGRGAIGKAADADDDALLLSVSSECSPPILFSNWLSSMVS